TPEGVTVLTPTVLTPTAPGATRGAMTGAPRGAIAGAARGAITGAARGAMTGAARGAMAGAAPLGPETGAETCPAPPIPPRICDSVITAASPSAAMAAMESSRLIQLF